MKTLYVVVASIIASMAILYAVPYSTKIFTATDLNGIFQLTMFILIIYLVKQVGDLRNR